MNTETILEFDRIKDQLSLCAVSSEAKEKLLTLAPFLDESECNLKMNETTQARTLLDTYGTPPLSSMTGLADILLSVEQHAMLYPEQLITVSSFITTCERLMNYLAKAETSNLDLAFFGRSMINNSDVRTEIVNAIRNNTVDDCASNELKNIRKKKLQLTEKIREKLESMLKNRKECFTENYISVRNGHYVLPVRKECKHQIKGTTYDVSSSGNTCFMEPAAVTALIEEVTLLEIAEENEIHKILYLLTGMVEDILPAIRLNMDAMVTLDIIFAKVKYSSDLKAHPAILTTGPVIRIDKGRHPLLNAQSCVPLDFEFGEGIRGIIITGPNTGGKTVALKTVGLLTLMAQSGLHIPASTTSIISMRDAVLCDIGDGQSISENLSTFSSHITHIISILKHTTKDSLVLLDELGSGTDPAEGMGIAISILEELRHKGCLFVATTHYPEVKEYAESLSGILNARMTFNRETLSPNYQLEIGTAGESCALYIAERLGFPKHMLSLAKACAYREVKTGALNAGNQKDSFASILETTKEAYEQSKQETPKVRNPELQKTKDRKPANQTHKILSKKAQFQIGDSVLVYPKKEIGLVYQTVNDKGELGIQIKGRKQLISYKRLKLNVPASELYPPDYDFSIIFDSVKNRKTRHAFDRKHSKDLTIDYSDNENLNKYKSI